MDYQCYAYRDPLFVPAMRLIASITLARIPTVTTTFDHGYVDGTIVRFDIPPACGMPQINQLTSPILVTGLTTFTIDIDTTLFQPFVSPVGLGPFIDVCAQVNAFAEINSTLDARLRNVLDNTNVRI